MTKVSVEFVSTRKKSRQPKPTVLADGTVCYTKPVRYPNEIIDALRELSYEKKFDNMSQTVFYCIDAHEGKKLLSKEKRKFNTKAVKSLTLRFREYHYAYIEKVCEEKGLKSFSSGIIHIIYEYLKAEERI